MGNLAFYKENKRQFIRLQNKHGVEYCQVKSTNIYETISSKGKLNIVYFIALCDHLTCGYHIQIAIKALSTAVKNINYSKEGQNIEDDMSYLKCAA